MTSGAARPPGANEPRPAWHRRAEAGTTLGLWFVETVARRLGRRVAHLIVWPVAAYFLCTRGDARRASLQFLGRALGREARLRDALRHFVNFARVTVDRVFLLAPHGEPIPMRVEGRAALEALLARGESCILLSAHFGSFEAARQAGLSSSTLRLRVLLDRAVNLRLVRRLERIDPQFAASIIDAAGDPREMILAIGDALRRGEWIGWLGDRHRDGERTVRAEFLGAPASFPASPFIVAKIFKVPVYMIVAASEATGYDVHAEPLIGAAELEMRDRDAFVQLGVERYARQLARHAQRSPWNWFNFYDFWRA